MLGLEATSQGLPWERARVAPPCAPLAGDTAYSVLRAMNPQGVSATTFLVILLEWLWCLGLTSPFELVTR